MTTAEQQRGEGEGEQEFDRSAGGWVLDVIKDEDFAENSFDAVNGCAEVEEADFAAVVLRLGVAQAEAAAVILESGQAARGGLGAEGEGVGGIERVEIGGMGEFPKVIHAIEIRVGGRIDGDAFDAEEALRFTGSWV